MENELADLNTERNKLLSFSNIANSTIGPNKEKVFEIFWILERARQQLKNIELDFSVSDPMHLSREQIRSSIRKLEDVAKARTELPDHIISGWKDYTPKTIFPGDEDKIHKMLMSTISELRAFMQHLEEQSSILCDSGSECTLQLVEQVGGETGIDTSVLNSRPNEFDQELAAAFVHDNNLDLAEEFDAIVEQYQRSLSDSEPIHESLKALTLPQLTDILDSCAQLIEAGYGNVTVNHLYEISSSLSGIVEDVDIFTGHISSLEKLFQEPPFSLNQILEIKRVLNETPPDVYLYGHPSHLSDFALGLCKGSFRQAYSIC
jgi:hypothetical protein